MESETTRDRAEARNVLTALSCSGVGCSSIQSVSASSLPVTHVYSVPQGIDLLSIGAIKSRSRDDLRFQGP